jgi:hypothetical protein
MPEEKYVGPGPKERLMRRQWNSGASRPEFQSRGNPRPKFTYYDDKNHNHINLHGGGTQSSPSDNPLQPGPDLMGRRS